MIVNHGVKLGQLGGPGGPGGPIIPWKIHGLPLPDDGVGGAGLHLQLREGIKGCNLAGQAGGVVIHWRKIAGITII